MSRLRKSWQDVLSVQERGNRGAQKYRRPFLTLLSLRAKTRYRGPSWLLLPLTAEIRSSWRVIRRHNTLNSSGSLCPPAPNCSSTAYICKWLISTSRGGWGRPVQDLYLRNLIASAPTICPQNTRENSYSLDPRVQVSAAVPVSAWTWKPCIGVAWWGSLQLCQTWSPKKNEKASHRRLARDSDAKYTAGIKACESAEQEGTQSELLSSLRWPDGQPLLSSTGLYLHIGGPWILCQLLTCLQSWETVSAPQPEWEGAAFSPVFHHPNCQSRSEQLKAASLPISYQIHMEHLFIFTHCDTLTGSVILPRSSFTKKLLSI